MAVIEIREQEKTETGFEATLIIEGNSYPITVSDPFNTEQEEELEWYFEDWLIYPMLDNIKAGRAKASVREYGEELFRQVFQSNSEAYANYSDLKPNLSQLTIEIASINPEFQAIDWEALRDPELTHPFAIDTILIRKGIQPKQVEVKVKESPTINLLVVVARPNAEYDIPHRTISRPLVETIRKAKLRVNIEILRPGTYEALAKHLESKGQGYYHIVHFDVHGALKTYENYQAGIESKHYLQPRYGRDEIQPYEGVKAFLAFEGNQIYLADPVEASEIANLLTSKDIPVCILNACQSGKQLNQIETEDNRETSLGSRLMNAGMQMVVAMSYSVTPRAAEIMMQQLYKHLFDEQDINQAILLGRKELYNRKARKAAYNTEIDLEDWLLPVVYSNGEVTFNLREFTLEEATEYNLNLASKYKFSEPKYGFVGRDIDILLIEKALLQHNILLLQGMGGTGKTTLLNHLREWWQVTKFAEDTFYFAYDRRAYTLQQIIFEISKELYNKFDFKRFRDNSFSEQCQEISHKLRNEPYVLILDNLESITGQPLTIQNTLEEVEKEEIKDFLASLVDGKTKVILGSRIAEEWLELSTFQDNSYQLRDLDPQASSDLAANILQEIESSQSLYEINTDEYFKRLMKLLDGNPLAIKVVLPNLKDRSQKKVLEQLEKAEIDPGGDDKESNIFKCIEYSYSNLSESAQELLIYLAPFKKFINSSPSAIRNYIKELSNLEFSKEYNLNKLNSAIAEASYWGLLYPANRYFPNYLKHLPDYLLEIHPLLPYFLQKKLKDKANQFLTKQELQNKFKNHYLELSCGYNFLLHSEVSLRKQEAKVIINLEYENLFQALQYCLEKQESIINIINCLNNYLEFIDDSATQLSLGKFVYISLEKYETSRQNQSWELEIIGVLDIIARYHLNHKEYNQAEKVYQQNLAYIEKVQKTSIKIKQTILARTYNQLAYLYQEIEKRNQAEILYVKAINLCIEYEDFEELGKIYTNLGTLYEEIEKYQKAKKYYDLANKINKGNNYDYQQARNLRQFASVAEESKEYRKAIKFYRESLNVYDEYKDCISIANIYADLGRVVLTLKKYNASTRCFKKALGIYITYEEIYFQAQIYHNLGVIAQDLGDDKQAENYYKKALTINIDYKDLDSISINCINLGILKQNDFNFEESKKYYLQPLKISEDFNKRKYLLTIIKNVAKLYQQTNDDSILKEVATTMGYTEEVIKETFLKSSNQS